MRGSERERRGEGEIERRGGWMGEWEKQWIEKKRGAQK